ncbi:nucleoside recognition domain-containing protein [Mycoplasmatota bacterium WC44]
MIISGITYSLFTGNAEELTNIIISFPLNTFETVLPIFMTVIFWSGIIKVANDAKLIYKLSSKMKWLMRMLFPELPKDSKAHEYISANFIANILGLGSVATPLGLKAFEEMQKENKTKVATTPMITFLLINTSGLTIIPTTILALRGKYNPLINAELIGYIFLATLTTTIFAIFLSKVAKRL